ncbi:MAG: hypothetical protein A3G23_15115 [Bacteroidetes bacterium RIFCSPLOWO2_12_FULL_37_12]|nr:MAG: hypothetical protein A3G23_15115 [Bacteroidetes bacterium RIFCSPLOWO2_12_FULL_37_12]
MKITNTLFLVSIFLLSSNLKAQYCTSSGHNNATEWIESVSLNSLNNKSGIDANGYGDFTLMYDSLSLATFYTLSVEIGGTYSEYVDAWIDYNQDNAFDSTEKIMDLNGTDTLVSLFKVPATALNGATRLRIILNYYGPNNDPCAMDLQYGEAEDYGIYISTNPVPPVPDFFYDKTLSCDGVIQFWDLTSGIVDNVLWDFGDGTTSVLQNPVHTYMQNGTFTVKLTATNAYGSNTMTKSNLISIVAGSFYCDTTVVPDSGDGGTITACQGLIIDAGKNGDYPSDCNGYITINPTGFSMIKLTINYFESETNYDYLYIYDGRDTAAPLLAVLNGSSVPDDTVFNSSSESLTLRFTSDGGVNKAGFMATWECITISDKPNAEFSANTLNTCSSVYFKDLSENLPNDWLWDFGDGTTSIEKNPFHQYTQNGSYTIKLRVSNSFGSDSLTKPSYINVDNTLFFCDTLVIPDSGSGGTFTTCKGLLMDAGKNQSYHPNANGFVTIDPAGLSYISLIVKFFDVYNYSDTLFVYDGPDASYPLIGAFNGTLLGINDTIQSTGETLTLKFISNSWTENDGFEFWWDCVPVTTPPIAKFTPDKLISCGTVTFKDESTGIPDTWLWNFGDGNTSTERNPTHTYLSNGNYFVTLTVSNPFGNNSYAFPNSILVDASSYLCDTLLFVDSATVTFNQCNGLLMDDGGKNYYSNSQQSIVTIAPTGTDLVKLIFQSFNTESGYDYLYIYDGTDTSSALIGKYAGTALPEGGTILSSGTSLTLYFTADGVANREGFVIIWECITVTQPPVANFTADNLFSCGKVSFSDTSSNYPNSWVWDFGDGTNSVEQNPVHYYSNNGTYTVSLIAGNNLGNDTLVKTNYITVDKYLVYCDTILLPDSGVGILQTNCEGVLADDGGGDSAYSADANGYITISTGSASSIKLTFSEFESELNYDYLYIYADTDTVSNLVGKYSGTLLPGGGVVIVPGNSVTVKFTSDYGAQKKGFILNWKCQYDTVPPVADFEINQQTPCGMVEFIDRSVYTINSWNWDFGDGQFSSDINPVHFYSASGLYSVTLIVAGPWGADTLSMPDAVTVDKNSSFCDSVFIPVTGAGTTQTQCSGQIFDSGGAGNYQSNTDGSLTITTSSDKIIQLTFFSFSFENNADYLYIHDGADVMQPLIGSFTGDVLPGGGTVFSTGDAVTLRQKTDGGINKSGFSASWECKLKTIREQDLSGNFSFDIYPNPANGNVYLITNAVQPGIQLCVTDISGRKVFEKEINSFSGNVYAFMNVSELKSGAYIISIRNRNGMVSRRLLMVE